MILLSRFNKLLDINDAGSGVPDTANLLVRKGDQLHEVILYVVAIYGVVFTILNYWAGTTQDAILTLCILPLTGISYFLLKINWVILSKTWNLIQVVAIISLLSLTTTSKTGVLTYFFPVLMCIQLVFQGKQRNYGHLLSVLTLLWLIFLMVTEIQILNPVYTEEALRRERIWNYTGSGIATLLGMMFILRISDRMLERLVSSSTEVQQKNNQLTKANTELDNFVYRVSHDLRSPLVSVKGLLSLVFDVPEMPSKAHQYLVMADRSINRLDDTIREILEYSRNSRLEVKIEPFDINRMAEGIFEDLRFSAPPDIRLHLTGDGSNMINSDGYRLNTVLRNLIGNAVKYASSDNRTPSVDVRYKHNGGHLTVEVIDNGIGIDPKHHNRVFDMFYRATSTGSGTGLGLYICQEIITKLGGTIKLTSAPGSGTTISFTIPSALPASA